MPSYAEAIFDVIYKGVCWVFGSFLAKVLPKQAEKLPRHLIAVVLSTTISKACMQLRC